MVKKIIKYMLIGVGILALVGCGENSKEVVFKEGQGENYENTKVKIEKFSFSSDKEGFDGGNVVLGGYDNNFYGFILDNNCDFGNDNNQLDNKFDPSRYVIRMGGNLEKDSKKAVYLGENHENEGVAYKKDKGGKILGLYYYNQEKEVKKDIRKIENGENLKVEEGNPFPVTGIVENNNKYAYYQVLNNLNRNEGKSSFELIEIENGEAKKIKLQEGRVAKIVYLDGFYILQDDLSLTKINSDNFKIEKKVDLSKEFGYTDSEESWINNAGLVGDELVINGSTMRKLTENDNKINMSKDFIIKYNLKTGEKKVVDLGVNEELEEFNIRTFNPKTNTIILSKEKGEDVESLLGKVVDNKVKILKNLNLGERNKPFVSIIDVVEDKKGEEIMISYSITNNGQYDESQIKGALIKIN